MSPLENKQNDKIPVTVLTGFLGSGKTTLLNRILTGKHGYRIAVIENEFGEIGIDHELVVNAEEEVFEMNNGCICCTVRGDLIRILGNLTKKKNKFDYVIIETTGMADPGPVAQTFFVDDDIKENYRLDGVVTLVDSKHILNHLDESDECKQQIAFADVILMNKADLVSPDELSTVKKRVKSVNGVVNLIETQMANAPIEHLLKIRAFDLNRALEINPLFLKPEYPFEAVSFYSFAAGDYKLILKQGPDPDLKVFISNRLSNSLFNKNEKQILTGYLAKVDTKKHLDSLQVNMCSKLDLFQDSEFFIRIEDTGTYAVATQHHPSEFKMQILSSKNQLVAPEHIEEFNPEHEHEEEVGSVGLELIGDVDLQKFQKWIGSLLASKGNDIYRSKGVISMHGVPEKYIFQGVHMLMNGELEKPWGQNIRKTQLVFIGKNLDRNELKSGLESCRYG